MSNTQGIGAIQANGQKSKGGNDAQRKREPQKASIHEGHEEHEEKRDTAQTGFLAAEGRFCSCLFFSDFVSLVFLVDAFPLFIE
jgi:hypothetical protein